MGSCRRKVRKFLDTIDVSSQRQCQEEPVLSNLQTENDGNAQWHDANIVVENEPDEMVAETAFDTNETPEVTCAGSNAYTVSGMGVSELMEDC